MPWAAAHADAAEQYVRKTEYLYARLGRDWQMPLEQIWFYECERDAAIRERRLNKFLMEMPGKSVAAIGSEGQLSTVQAEWPPEARLIGWLRRHGLNDLQCARE